MKLSVNSVFGICAGIVLNVPFDEFPCALGGNFEDVCLVGFCAM
jgi:hypothetical protein